LCLLLINLVFAGGVSNDELARTIPVVSDILEAYPVALPDASST
jgi:hypothetical protein